MMYSNRGMITRLITKNKLRECIVNDDLLVNFIHIYSMLILVSLLFRLFLFLLFLVSFHDRQHIPLLL